MGLLPVVVCLTLLGSTKSYPLAAAMVVNEKLMLIDLPTRTARELDIGTLVPDEADLSTDKQSIVFNAAQRGSLDGSLRPYLLHLPTMTIEKLSTLTLGNVRAPRFGANGKIILYTAPKGVGAPTPDNPSRAFQYTRLTGKTEELPTAPETCNFSPTPLASGFVHLATHCFLGFELVVTDSKTKAAKTFASVSGARTEIASSPDGDKLVYTTDGPGGIEFWTWTPKSKPQRLAVVSRAAERVQPRFTCPKDLLFNNDGRYFVLDSVNGKVSALTDLTVTRLPFDGGSR